MKINYRYLIVKLTQENISLKQITKIALDYQSQYSKVPSINEAKKLLITILSQPQVAQNFLVVLALKEHKLSEPLQTVYQHEPLLTNLFLEIAGIDGVIGISNFWEIKLNHPQMINSLSSNSAITNLVLALIAALSGKLAQLDS